MQFSIDLQPVLTVLTWLVGPGAVLAFILKARTFANQLRASITTALVFLTALVGLLGVKGYAASKFDNECSAYVEAAYRSNDIGQASKYLEQARKYLKDNGMTSGYTGVLYQNPKDNVDEWYDRLSSLTSRVTAAKIARDSGNATAIASLTNLPGSVLNIDVPFWQKAMKDAGLIREGFKPTDEPVFVAPACISTHPYNSVLTIVGIGIGLCVLVSTVWVTRSALAIVT